MAARIKKSLLQPENGYAHREHRSRRGRKKKYSSLWKHRFLNGEPLDKQRFILLK